MTGNARCSRIGRPPCLAALLSSKWKIDRHRRDSSEAGVIQSRVARPSRLAIARQFSGELFRKVAAFYHRIEGADETAKWNQVLRLELKNGSRVIALPGSESTVRGYSGADLIVIDEAARVSDELRTAITPATATKPNARHLYLSTPFGKRGFFWREWSEGGDTWARYSVTAKDCPRISAEFLRRRTARPRRVHIPTGDEKCA